MKTAVMLFLLLTVVSCQAQEGQTNSGADSIDSKAEIYLQSLLTTNEPLEKITASFGIPWDHFKTHEGELCLIFMFFDKNNDEARKAGVGGFQGFFVNDKLTHWHPILASWAVGIPKYGEPPPRPVAFDLKQSSLEFQAVSEEQKDNTVYVDSQSFPKLGYINKSPDLAIHTGQYVVRTLGENGIGSLELVLSQEDGEKLQALTTENIGKRLAIVVDSDVIAAPNINEPISGGRVVIQLPVPVFTNLLKALKN